MSNTYQTEQEVLGAVLLSESAYWDAAEFLTADSFAAKDHKVIFEAMGSLASKDRTIRATALSTRLGDMEDGTAPLVYMAQLVEIAKKATEEEGFSVSETAEDLARAHVKRRIMGMLKNIEKTANNPTADPFEILDGMISQASDLVHDADQKIERSIVQVGEDAKALLQQAVAQRGIGLTTGLSSIDGMAGRIFPGDFILLGGQPGGGKTSLAMQIAVYISQFVPVAFIELEMESRMMLLRTLAASTGITVRSMLDGVKTGQFETLTDSIQSLSTLKLHMVSHRGMTITQVEARIRSLKRRKGIQLVFVDHIGLIKRVGKYRLNKHEKDFDNAEDLMELGKALGLPIVALCHLTKAARQKDGDPEPTMEDFSGGGMEQHADLMLCTFNRYDWLDRNKPKTGGKAMEQWLLDRSQSENRMELYKLKDRKGPMRERRIMHWNGERMLFSDIDTRDRQEALL